MVIDQAGDIDISQTDDHVMTPFPYRLAYVSEAKRFPEIVTPDEYLNFDDLKGDRNSNNPKDEVAYWKSLARRMFAFIKVIALNSYVDLESPEETDFVRKMQNAPAIAKRIMEMTKRITELDDLNKQVISLFRLKNEDRLDGMDYEVPDNTNSHVMQLLSEYHELLAVANGQLDVFEQQRWPKSKQVKVSLHGLDASLRARNRDQGANQRPPYQISSRPDEVKRWEEEIKEFAEQASYLPSFGQPDPVLPGDTENEDGVVESHALRDWALGVNTRSVLRDNIRTALKSTMELTPLIAELQKPGDPPLNHERVHTLAFELLQREALPFRVLASYPYAPLGISSDQVFDQVQVWYNSFELLNRYAQVRPGDADATSKIEQVFESLANNRAIDIQPQPPSAPNEQTPSGLVEEKKGGDPAENVLGGGNFNEIQWRPLVIALSEKALLFSAMVVEIKDAEEKKRMSQLFPRPNGSFQEYRELTMSVTQTVDQRREVFRVRLNNIYSILRGLGIRTLNMQEAKERINQIETMNRLIRETSPLQKILIQELKASVDASDSAAVRAKVKQLLTKAEVSALAQDELTRLDDLRKTLIDFGIDPGQLNEFLNKFGKNPAEAIKHSAALKAQHDAMVSYGQLCASVTKNALGQLGSFLEEASVAINSFMSIIRNFYINYANEEVATAVNRLSDALSKMFTGNFKLVGLNPDETVRVRRLNEDPLEYHDFILINDLESVYRLASTTVVKLKYRQRWQLEEQKLSPQLTIDAVWSDLHAALTTFASDTISIADSLVVLPKKAREVVPFARVTQTVLNEIEKLRKSRDKSVQAILFGAEKNFATMQLQIQNEATSLRRDVNDRIADVIRKNEVKFLYAFTMENLGRNVDLRQMNAPPLVWADLSRFFVDLVAAFNISRPTPEIVEIKEKLISELPALKNKVLTLKGESEELGRQLNTRNKQLITVVESHNKMATEAQDSVSVMAAKAVSISTKQVIVESDAKALTIALQNGTMTTDGTAAVGALPDSMTLVMLNVPRFKQTVNAIGRILTNLSKYANRLETKMQESRMEDAIQEAMRNVNQQPPMTAETAADMIASAGNVLGSEGQAAAMLSMANYPAGNNGNGRGRRMRESDPLLKGQLLRLPGLNDMGRNQGNGDRNFRGPNVMHAAMDPVFAGQFDKPRELKTTYATVETTKPDVFKVKYEDLMLFMFEVAGSSLSYDKTEFFVNPMKNQIVIPSSAFLSMLGYIEEFRVGERSQREIITRMLSTGRDIWWIEEEYASAVVEGRTPETPGSMRARASQADQSSIRDADERKDRQSRRFSPEKIDLENDDSAPLAPDENGSVRLVDRRVEVPDREENEERKRDPRSGSKRRARDRTVDEEDGEDLIERKQRLYDANLDEDEVPRRAHASSFQTPARRGRVIFNPNIELSPEEKKMRDVVERAVNQIGSEQVHFHGSRQQFTLKELSLAVRKNFVNAVLRFIEFIYPLESCKSAQEFDALLSNYVTVQPLQAMRIGLQLINQRGGQYEDVTMHELMFSPKIRLYYSIFIGARMSSVASMENSGYVQVRARQQIENSVHETTIGLSKFTKRLAPYSWKITNAPVKDLIIKD